MAIFNPITITDGGKAMLAQAISGGGDIVFTAVSTSTTIMSGDLESTTQLTGIKQTVTPSTAMMTDDTIQVSSVFSNAGVSQEYTINTLGLYAKTGADPILFAIATASSPDVMPAQNTLSPSNFFYQFNISVGSAVNVSVDVQESGGLTSAAFYSIFPGLVAPTNANFNNMIVYKSPGQWSYEAVPSTETLEETVQSQGEDISDLQTTVQNQGSSISNLQRAVQINTQGISNLSAKLAKMGLESFVSSTSPITGQNIPIDDVSLQANTVYMINVNAQITGESGEHEYTPTLKASFGGTFTAILATGSKVYVSDASGNSTYINETFFLSSDIPYEDLQFSLDSNSHTFGRHTITVFKLGTTS